ncbi:hypothetical protein [Cupriavidus basilensis]|uniref:hypothetical protein n=1 Tax=Cupriavidus basilensis TaxID=68895 RepID=UPI0020A6A75C|nr:hypothetical protein [Cupriavidus basilensis]MCP3022279.1 hypothetical protein [Cupriavidus basilensis]
MATDQQSTASAPEPAQAARHEQTNPSVVDVLTGTAGKESGPAHVRAASCEPTADADSIRYALARHVPDMARGFSIQTNYGDLVIEAEDATAFAMLARAILQGNLAHAEAL